MAFLLRSSSPFVFTASAGCSTCCWQWLAASLTFVGAHAQQKASEEATFRKLIDGYCAAWSTLNPDNAAKFYAKDDGLVFYDLAPFSYSSWKEYHTGVQKEFFDTAASGKLTAGKELRVTRRGTIAWTTVPMHISITGKDGKITDADVRYTGIWERRARHGCWYTSICRCR